MLPALHSDQAIYHVLARLQTVLPGVQTEVLRVLCSTTHECAGLRTDATQVKEFQLHRSSSLALQTNGLRHTTHHSIPVPVDHLGGNRSTRCVTGLWFW